MGDSAAATITNLERAGSLCRPVLQSAFRSLRLPPGSRGIDIGCGIGLSTVLLAEATQPGDMRSLPFERNTFDWAWRTRVRQYGNVLRSRTDRLEATP